MGPQWALRLRMMLNTDMCLAFSEMEGPRGPGGTLDCCDTAPIGIPL